MSQSRARQLNRAEVVDRQFLDHLDALERDPPRRESPGVDDADLLELFDSQLASRQLDLMARIKRQENKVFYTIGSAGHEGNAAVAAALDPTDPAFLHYRSGGFFLARAQQIPGPHGAFDVLRGCCAGR